MVPTVLLLDAFGDEREMYAEYLHAKGFAVRAFEDADAALADARVDVPGIVVTRLRLPNREMAGLAFIERMKSDPATHDVPILVIATSTIEAERRAAFVAGCDGYILLPCLPEDLVAEIDEVRLHRQDEHVAHAHDRSRRRR